MEKQNIHPKLRKAIQIMYREHKCYVRKETCSLEMFIKHDGLKQGFVLNTTLFLLIMDDIIMVTERELQKLHIGYNKLNPTKISERAFADDPIIFCVSGKRVTRTSNNMRRKNDEAKNENKYK